MPDPLADAFGDEAVPGDVAADLAARLDGPLAPVILATAAQIARAQAARRGDGLPPYPPAEVMRLIDAIGTHDAAEPLSLSIVEAGAGSVTFRVGAEDDLPPEMLARIVKAMIDGAAADGIRGQLGVRPERRHRPLSVLPSNAGTPGRSNSQSRIAGPFARADRTRL